MEQLTQCGGDGYNLFKKCLDKFWFLNDFVYLRRAQPLETGSVK